MGFLMGSWPDVWPWLVRRFGWSEASVFPIREQLHYGKQWNPLIKLHQWVDKPFHPPLMPDGHWWPRNWKEYFAMAIPTYSALVAYLFL